MFNLNSYMISKMGWRDYHEHIGIGLTIGENKKYNLFEGDPLVRHFFIDEDLKICYVIKELSETEKHIHKNKYNFIVCRYANSKNRPSFKKIGIGSNMELFKLIIDNLACGATYKRNFKINKTLRK